MAMSGNCVSALTGPSLIPLLNVWPWSVEREKLIVLPPLPLYDDHEKYTLPSQALFVRSTSIAVLSLNLPPVPGAEDPRATVTERRNSLPSSRVLPAVPEGLPKVATQTSPKPFFVPAGSSLA